MITVCQDEEIDIEFNVLPIANKAAKRNLHINLKVEFKGSRSELTENNTYKMR